MVPKISVVIPLYNKGPQIARAIDSVLNQTFQDFEIIIINDGSTDGGAEIVKLFNDSRIQLINQTNRGVSFSRNRGVKYAQSDFIAFLDADDEWLPNHLEIIERMRHNYPNAGAYFTAFKINQKSGKIIEMNNFEISYPFEGILPDYFRFATFGDTPIGTSFVALSKNTFWELGGFMTGEWMGEDIDLWAKIALKYPIAFSSVTSGIYHIDASNRACDKTLPLTEEVVVRTGKRAIQDGTVPDHLVSSFKDYLIRIELATIRRNIITGNTQSARKMLANVDTRIFQKEKFFLIFMSFMPNFVLRYAIMIRRTLNNS